MKKTIHQILHDRITAPLGSHEPVDFAQLCKSEWSDDFESYMRNRLLMGSMRYGKIKDNKGSTYDRVNDSIRRLKLYQQDGNDEHLVDVANLMLLEFVCGIHPKKHFKAGDDTTHCKL